MSFKLKDLSIDDPAYENVSGKRRSNLNATSNIAIQVKIAKKTS